MLLEKIYTAYAPENDITFIMKDSYDPNGDVSATEVVGWHYGEPCNASRNYVNDLKATYK